MTRKLKLGDTVRGEWRALVGVVPVEGVVVSWDIWSGEVVGTLRLAAPVEFVSPPRYDGDVRHEVTVPASGLVLVSAGPALTAEDLVDMSAMGMPPALSAAGERKCGLVPS